MWAYEDSSLFWNMSKHFNEACVIKCFLNLVKLSSDVWEQLGDKHRFHENLMPFHFFTFDSLVQLKTLLKLMWNDSPSSRPYPHLQSCQRCIVLYVHAMRSFIIFVSPTTLLPRSPSTPNTTPPTPTPAILSSHPPPPDFLLITFWHTRDMLTDGCPGLCNNNGRCVLDQNVWHCVCQSGWRGLGCDVATEMLCSDGKDNEGGRKKKMPCTNSLLTSAGVCVCVSDCAKLALMWPLGDGANKQN